MNGEALAPMLRRLRVAADMTLEELATTAGVTDRALSDLERGASRGARASTIEALADALRLDATARAALSAAAHAGRRRGQMAMAQTLPLPSALADFTGRAAELATIQAVVSRTPAGSACPAVLINGEPGIGKSALAVQAATRLAPLFPDGRFFVDLQGLADHPLSPEVLLMRLIQAVEPTAGSFPPRLADVTAVWRSVSKGKRIIIVLDNAANEAQVRAAMPAHGPALVIVTSRRLLSGLESVDRVVLSPFQEREAVTLLAEISADRPAGEAELRELARLCANLPLAIRVAGNRLASRTDKAAGDLLARMSDQQHRLSALSAGELKVSAAFSLSYEQLSVDGRRLFRRLSLTYGATCGAAIAAIVEPQSVVEAEDALDELIELGLLQESEGHRVTFHDLLRLYAKAKLREDDDPDDVTAVRTRLRNWLLDTTIVAGLWYEPDSAVERPDVRGTAIDSPEAAKAWLKAEAENWFGALAEAAEIGDHQRVVDVAESLHWFSDHWLGWGRWHEVFALSSAAASSLCDDRLQATHLGYLSWAHNFCLAQYEAGSRFAQRAFFFAQRAGDRQQMAWARTYQAWALLPQDRYLEALAPARESVEHFAAAGDREGLPQALIGLGNVLRSLGRHEEALDAIEHALTLVTDPRTAPRSSIAYFTTISAHAHAAHVHVHLRQWEKAVESVDTALRPHETPIPFQHRIRLLGRRAEAYQHLGEHSAARDDLETVLRLQEAADDEDGAARTRRRLRHLPGSDQDTATSVV
ncbi:MULTISPECIES: helix-turn-helix domain-containing protein [Catenuloplanes]|uniref:Tetratricopeptide (TPR) repeat protein/transcriptional regulator with XRE-family HTH domain n=1 Tax=Catenuloplanes niger TaxID=587534 RepID=A0AAE3ZKC6_9ACTN|nr:helix-turn-helix domain-containing protein [Catenuloplanes niger]MDR7320806.1 tetratricopeptide (TPR) repeat protein/transcriptional regulator with XRE-family HTH domain [Catenuloplanes niger]